MFQNVCNFELSYWSPFQNQFPSHLLFSLHVWPCVRQLSVRLSALQLLETSRRGAALPPLPCRSSATPWRPDGSLNVIPLDHFISNGEQDEDSSSAQVVSQIHGREHSIFSVVLTKATGSLFSRCLATRPQPWLTPPRRLNTLLWVKWNMLNFYILTQSPWPFWRGCGEK